MVTMAENHELLKEEKKALKADIIYLMMRKEYHISCNLRVQWFLDHLNAYITVPPVYSRPDEQLSDLEVVSVLPVDPPAEWRPENSYLYRYLITTQSSVVFLTRQYRVAFCLDMSPSVSAVDIQHGEVMSDEILVALRRSVEGMIQPFVIPGSCVRFEPDIYVTVMAHTPFFATPAQQVLVQGYHVTPQNVSAFLSCVETQLTLLEDVVAEVTNLAHDQLDALRADSERLVGDLFEEEHSESQAPSSSSGHAPMVSPDAGFINMLRYGLLALRLLPESSSSNLVVLTDGIVATPDVKVLDSVVTQLRANSVACSFIQLGSRFHPHCSAGLVPYRDLLQYLASATQGCYITELPEAILDKLFMNVYHNAFLTWSFRRTSYEFCSATPQAGEWHVSNNLFYGRREPQLLLKKQAEDNLNVSLSSLLCCRLHQGYTVKNVCMKDGQVELSLVQAWNSHIFLDYKLTAPWPEGRPVHYSLSIQAPYEFLHDITCLLKKPLGSPYRQLVVSRFWHTLKTLGQSDQLLVVLPVQSSGASNPPDVVRNGVPLFNLSTNLITTPVLTANETNCQVFSQFWKPLTVLDPTMWHTHNLVMLLRHDTPLPPHLHLPNNSGRFQVVQCRQAAASLNLLLKDWSTFVLIENHSYVRFLAGEPTSWFFLIRVTSKPPCVVIQLAFLGGTPGSLRYQMVEQLSQKIRQIAFPQRPSSNASVNCCLLLHKPVDKILIRYERMPTALETVVFPDGTQPALALAFGPALAAQGSTNVTAGAGALLTTLSRYLHHRRWVWAAQSGPRNTLGQEAISRILAILTKKRLREGFSFAHSTSGIINMVLEIEMTQKDHSSSPQYCVIQYVLFPPHINSSSVKDSGSEDEGADDADMVEEGEMQLVTECWVEPQHGLVGNSPPERMYLNGLPYNRLADVICQVDAECISSLLTVEHVKLMCEQGHVSPPETSDAIQILSAFPQEIAVWAERRIRCLPFAYNLTSLLPRCQQAELLYSMFVQDLTAPSVNSVVGGTQDPDVPNNLLLAVFLEQLSMLHDRELPLSAEDSIRLEEQLRSRPRASSAPALPLPPEGTLKSRPANWRCFVRRMHADRVLFTLVPASYGDLKVLMTSDFRNLTGLPGIKLLHGESDASNSAAQPDSPATPLPQQIDTAPVPQTPTTHTPFPLHNNYSSTCEANHLLNHFSRRLRSSELENSLGTQCSLDSPFRVRASSWDPKSGGSSLSVKRARTSSMGAKSKPSKLSVLPAPAAESSPICKWLNSNEPVTGVTHSCHLTDCDWSLESRPAAERSLSCEASLFRTRTQSMDSKNKRTGCTVQRKRSGSIDSKLRIPSRRRTISSQYSFGPSSPHPHEPNAHCHKGYPESGVSILGSVTLPVYVYDCPLNPLLESLVQGEFNHPPDIFEDRTFKWDCSEPRNTSDQSAHSGATINTTETKDKSSDTIPEGDESTRDNPSVQQLIRSVSIAYSKCFVQALFDALHSGLWLHAVDVQAAVDECEEALVEVDITRFLQTVCGHLKDMGSAQETDISNVTALSDRAQRCQDLKLLHKLIKDKFRTILGSAFRPVSSHQEFYYCIPAWDHKRLAMTDAGTPQPGTITGLTLQGDNDSVPGLPGLPGLGVAGWDGILSITTPDDAHTSLLSNMDSNSLSEIVDEGQASEEVCPLFLHLVCSVHANNSMGSYSIRTLPTCVNELVRAIDDICSLLNSNTFHVTLDILCLTLPRESESLSLSDLASRTSPQLQQQISNTSHSSTDDRLSVDALGHLPDYQQRAVTNLVNEMNWLMRDEMAACALDEWPVRGSTLQMVAEHIVHSPGRSTCLLETVPLHFVLEASKCQEKFVEALENLRVNGYRVQSENNLFYLVKDCEVLRRDHSSQQQQLPEVMEDASTPVVPDHNLLPRVNTESTIEHVLEDSSSYERDGGSGSIDAPIGLLNDNDICNWSEAAARHSEVSSLMESALGTEDGYDAGSSDSGQDCAWLLEMEQKRDNLPNFWLILRVEEEGVVVYFHCRFLDLETEEVSSYRAVFTTVLEQLQRLCRRVNQTLLLNALHDTRLCDDLLEAEQKEDLWNAGETILARLKSMEDSRDVDQIHSDVTSLAGSLKFEPGHFACDVVFELNFLLHPRLKTGPVKSGLCRGVQAVRTVLNRFCVQNRRNMFVYKDNQGNVFYLRLHENQGSTSKGGATCGPSTTGESSPSSVSRSSSIASLNTSKRLHPNEDVVSMSSASQPSDLRPRVRSFGEKDVTTPLSSSGEARWSASTLMKDDYITIKVHGISEAGPDVKLDLMIVLQNRLDDAVLEVLSVMLARNPMCKLYPQDVHFIQRPNNPPETKVQFSIPAHAELHVQALAYYLHQNLLHFLNQPKYTEPHSSCHFQDFSQLPDSPGHIPEQYLYLYNQTNVSGNRGMACLAMGIMDRTGNLLLRTAPYRRPQLWAHAEAPLPQHFQELTSVKRCWPDAPSVREAGVELESEARVEFRIWKQGRVNVEALVLKLESAVRHAVWDLLTEFTILTAPIEEPNTPAPTPVQTPTPTPNLTPTSTPNSLPLIPPNPLSRSQLHPVYHKSMQPWLEFAGDLGVAAVRKHNVHLASRHSLSVTVRELENLITAHAKDTRTAVFAEESDSGGVCYRAWRWSEDESSLPTRCLLLTRNPSQWRCFVADPSGPPSKADKIANKGLQRYLPLLATAPGDPRFVPRQRFLLTVVTSKDIAVLTYNWANDSVDSLTRQTTLLGHWLSARSSLLTSVVCQKMGLFHNQPIARSADQSKNVYLAYVGDLEVLTKFPRKEVLSTTSGSSSNRRSGVFSSGSSTPTSSSAPPLPSATSSNSNQGVSLSTLHSVFRDCKAAPLGSTPGDLVVRHARQMLATKLLDKHADQQRKLNTMWTMQTRGATPYITLSCDVLQTFIQHARTIHYCLTPLLFLPRWRLDSAATRDTTLSFIPPVVAPTVKPPQRRSSTALGLGDRWHQALCADFVNEYQQYLQTLGFIPVQMEASSMANRKRQCHYLQKSLLGGILMLELFLSEPFFHSRLHALECSRMQTKSSALISQFTLSFLDECDKVKVLLHLHSFAYDYHLRCLNSCATSPQSLLPTNYHLTLFLDDFLKYYSKAPNFARNLVHADTVCVPGINTPPQELFSFLLQHGKRYDMSEFSMHPVNYEDTPISPAEASLVQNEYVLVQHKTTPHLSYRDVHDLKQTDDFDVTLIVSHDFNSALQIQNDSQLCLKYYIILTSRRDLYPKPEIERKQGKFRTVSTASIPPVTPPPPPPTQMSLTPTSAQIPIPIPVVLAPAAESAPVAALLMQAAIADIAPSNSPLSQSVPTERITEESLTLLEVVTHDLSPETTGTDRLPSPASEATPDLVSTLVSLETTPTSDTASPVIPVGSVSSHTDPANHLSSSHHVEIKPEAVNYLGYYTSHEQLMHQLILQQAAAARNHIVSMVTQGAVHCRTHLLWSRLVCPVASRFTSREQQQTQSLGFGEFQELVRLAHVQPLSSIDPRLSQLFNQPLPWYQNLARVLISKYPDHNRQFFSPDGSSQHVVILHPRYSDAFVMLTLDSQTTRGDLSVVYRTNPQHLKGYQAGAGIGSSPCHAEEIHLLIEGIVNACCFHIWVGLVSP